MVCTRGRVHVHIHAHGLPVPPDDGVEVGELFLEYRVGDLVRRPGTETKGEISIVIFIYIYIYTG